VLTAFFSWIALFLPCSKGIPLLTLKYPAKTIYFGVNKIPKQTFVDIINKGGIIRLHITITRVIMTGQNIGYIRVSSEGQNTARQLEGIKLDKEFTDTMTGSIKSRPQLEECLNYLRKGDTLHVHSIDRLARNLRDLQEIIDGLVCKDVTVKFYAENLTFTGDDSPMSKLTLHLMGAFAEFERTITRTRQREGIEAAKKAGKHLGRPKLDKALRERARQLKTDGLSVVQISERMRLSRPSIYKLLKAHCG